MKNAALSLLIGFFLLTAQSCKQKEIPAPVEPSVKEQTQAPEPTPELAATNEMSPEEKEKQKALNNPYPNDFGPDSVDISIYSAEHREGYKLLQDKCSRCHSPARPINSQFLELKGEEFERAQKNQADIFKNKLVWQVDKNIWQRYVKRMMAKPGCNISQAEGKKIWRFLVEDSKRRKSGDKAAGWNTHRTKLLNAFKAKHPERYEELFK